MPHLMRNLTFLTNHARALLCVAREPSYRIRDIASTLGITERATQRIVSDLVEAGYLHRARVGRRNRYFLPRQFPDSAPVVRVRILDELLRSRSGALIAGTSDDRGVE